jgi:transcriptional regulator with XRE-family HTH domain
MDIKKDVGSRIKELRLQMGISQEALAHLADIDRTYMTSVENGRRNIAIVNLEKIITALNVTIQDFFTNELFNGSSKKGKKKNKTSINAK